MKAPSTADILPLLHLFSHFTHSLGQQRLVFRRIAVFAALESWTCHWMSCNRPRWRCLYHRGWFIGLADPDGFIIDSIHEVPVEGRPTFCIAAFHCFDGLSLVSHVIWLVQVEKFAIILFKTLTCISLDSLLHMNRRRACFCSNFYMAHWKFGF